MTHMKQKITRELLRLDLEGSIDDAIKQLQSYKAKYSDYTNLRIVEDCVYEGGYFYDLHGDRLETDQEQTARLEAKKYDDERQLEYDRKQYEALKAKFEKHYNNYMKKLYVSKPQDIPFEWKRYSAQKKTEVTIRACALEGESFKVSWSESRLWANPTDDLIIIHPDGKEYPCKKDIFFDTYQAVPFAVLEDVIAGYRFIKSAKSTLVAIPEGYDVTVSSLEGDLKEVRHPDYIVIGAKDELYVNTQKTVNEHMTVTEL